MATANRILHFEAGYPERVALKYATGKEVEGQWGTQVFFTLADGRGLYANPALAEKIEALGVQPGQPFEITKQKIGPRKTIWHVRRVEGEWEAGEARPEATQAAHHAQQTAISATTNHPAAHDLSALGTPAARMAAKMMACMCAMIDAAAEAQQYADRKGLKFSPEDIRCFASTAFIQLSKGGR